MPNMTRIQDFCRYLLFAGSVAFAQETPPPPAQSGTVLMDEFFKIDTNYAERTDEAMKPVEDLREKFGAALKRYQEESKKAGQLDGVVAATKMLGELEEEGAKISEASDPGAAKLRKAYMDTLVILERGVAEALKRAKQIRIQELDKLTETLTKEGKIQDAMEVREESKRVALSPEDSIVETKGPLAAGGKGVQLKPSGFEFRSSEKGEKAKNGYWIGRGKSFLDMSFASDALVISKAEKATFVFRVGGENYAGTPSVIEISCGGEVLGIKNGIKRGAVGRIPLNIAKLKAAKVLKFTLTVYGEKMMLRKLGDAPEVLLVLE